MATTGTRIRTRRTSGASEHDQREAWSDFDILSRQGLILVALVVCLLVAVLTLGGYWPLLILHVGGGATWMVLDVFLGFVLGPVLNAIAFPARMAVARRLLPRMLLLMPTAVTVTLAAGWRLGQTLGTIHPGGHRHGWVVASYFIAGALEFTALGCLQPANVAVLAELKRPAPDRAIVERLMRRFYGTAKVLAALQIAMLVIMTRVAS